MLRFRGFKSTFNLSTNKKSSLELFESTNGVSLIGAYRTNKDELFGTINNPNPHKRISPSMVTLPVRPRSEQNISKSTNNLAEPLNGYDNIGQSAPNITEVVAQEQLTRSQIKEQKRLEKQHLEAEKKVEKQRFDKEKKVEKQRLDEEKKVEKQRFDKEKKVQKQRSDEEKKVQKQRLDDEKKLEKQRLDEEKKQAKLAREQEKAEKLRKESEKRTQKKKVEDKKTKRKAPQPQTQKNAEDVEATPYTIQTERQEPTQNRDSSISTSSGPPPYTPPGEIINNKNDNSGNTSFALDQSTDWDLISQHRQQINRPTVVKSLPKQTHLDLHYNGPISTTDNSDA